MLNKIQPGEYSKGSGTDDALCIRNSDGNLNVFNVEHDDDGLWLNSNYDNPDNVWNAGNRWVFVRPRNSLCFSSSVLFLGTGLVSILDFESNRRAFYRHHQPFQTAKYIFYYPMILFPTPLVKRISASLF